MTTPSGSALPSRRDFLRALGASAAAAGLAAAAGAPPRAMMGRTDSIDGVGPIFPPGVPSAITVYKDPNCGCCTAWVKHITAAGFVPTVRNTSEMAPVKASMGVPSSLESCHTARVGNYTIEGHVPAELIVKLLQTKPVAMGLAVPGMPMGSPGMEGGTPVKYDVMLFDRAGKARVFASR